ncbi:G1 family glutamic endopeptidase [Ferrimicrobium acidiphilum]|uniref:G1 family glutamic endopeptidase n=1 Tax=Ferrimicrobium acidiphilum TaxID=121039 RepID=UPI0023F0E0BB|nr:G1 family glutamic endopeptidase [Ferrimicrobium acidiphilum]
MKKRLARTLVLASTLSFATHLAISTNTSYRLVTSNGTILNGSGGLTGHANDIVASFATPNGNGYWMVSSTGRVFAFGDARFYGDAYTDGLTGLSGHHPLNAPIVGGASTPGGHGYWLVASDGGVFNFGNAKFYGSTYSYGITGLSGARPLNAPIVGMARSGSGYLLVASDGGVFNFGGAKFYGSTYSLGLTGLSGHHPLNAPIVGVYPTINDGGYYMVASDGGVFNFGDAAFAGSAYSAGYTGLRGARPLPAPVTSILPNQNGSGYYIACENGQVISIGGAAPVVRSSLGRVIAIIPAGTQITTSSLPSATVGMHYRDQLQATDGVTWSATGLPPGMSLSASGLLSGTPTQAGQSDLQITATNIYGSPTSVNLVLNVSPPTVSSASANWAGYIESGSGFTSVSGEFNVASLARGQSKGSVSEWVGVGGLHGHSILQAGVTEFAGPRLIVPWIESYPAPATNIGALPISSGDIIRVSVGQTSGSWTVTIDDLTTNQKYATNVAYTGSPKSAEWIVESATPTLASYAPIHFQNLLYSGNPVTQIAMKMGQQSAPGPIGINGFVVQE